MTEKEIAYLRAIESHSGEWTWYQLDRFLSAKNVRFVDDMMDVLANLEKTGLVSTENRENHDYYLITAKGRQTLAAAAK